MRNSPLATHGNSDAGAGQLMLERRSFVVSCAAVVAGIAMPTTTSLEVSSSRPVEDSAAPTIALYIEGWDTLRESNQDAGSRVAIAINRSWGTAWR